MTKRGNGVTAHSNKRTPRTRARSQRTRNLSATERQHETAGPVREPEPVGAVHVVLDNTVPGGFRMEPV